jgi:hypothetical protein
MPTFVSLVNWTDQGIKTYRDSVRRAEDYRGLVEKQPPAAPDPGTKTFAGTTGMTGAGSPTRVLRSGSPSPQGQGSGGPPRDPGAALRHGTSAV